MEIEVKEVEPCKLSVHYVAGAEEILNKRGEVLNHFKKAPVKGFRPGKASIEAIKQHYKDQIEESVKRGLAEDAYHNTLFEKKLRPHGAPKFNSLLMADGKFVCEFDIHTKPDFELQPYSNLEIPKPAEQQNVAELTEKLLQELRVRFGEVTPFNETDFVQSGDSVIVDYEGSVDGEKVPHLCAEGEMITVGYSNLPTFDTNILGMSIGETREFNVPVPEGGLPSLAGKNVLLKVTLNMGSKTVPCPLDDSLAHKMGQKDFNELRAFAAGNASANIQQRAKQAVNEAVAHRLVDDNKFEVPNWLALSEAQYLAHNAKLDWNVIADVDKEKYLSMAEKNVKLSLVLDKIRETEPTAQLTDQEVLEVIKANLAKTKVQKPINEVLEQMQKTGYLAILFSRIKDEHTMDFVTKTVKFLE
jgi:trigger factor